MQREVKKNKMTDISISVQPLGCDVLKNCDANAQCVYDSHTNTHKCECYEGYDFFSKRSRKIRRSRYVGNGQTCVLIHSGQKNWEGQPQRPGPKQCREQTDCHQNAHCVVTEDGRTNICECLPGFRLIYLIFLKKVGTLFSEETELRNVLMLTNVVQ